MQLEKQEREKDARRQTKTSVFPKIGERSQSLGLEVSWEFWIGVACVTPTRSARSPWDASATCLHCGWQLWCPAGGLDGRTHRQHVSASLFGNLRPPSQREENFGREGWEKQKHREGFSGVCHISLGLPVWLVRRATNSDLKWLASQLQSDGNPSAEIFCGSSLPGIGMTVAFSHFDGQVIIIHNQPISISN